MATDTTAFSLTIETRKGQGDFRAFQETLACLGDAYRPLASTFIPEYEDTLLAEDLLGEASWSVRDLIVTLP